MGRRTNGLKDFRRGPLYNDRTMGVQVFGECTKCTEHFSGREIDIRCRQPWDPRRPKTTLAKELQQLIARMLGVDSTVIEIFTLMGTPLYSSTGASARIIFDSIEVSIRAVINPDQNYAEQIDVLMDGGVDVPLEKTAEQVIDIIKLRQKKRLAGRRRIYP
ncbi:hypothetical protein A2442_01915 [Candidatus Campbellbacteria bacterium RIFOXYC2_FULL_35_25]|uniref:Uncharacterized protein n=1 Tax=Candidatus Campbellbacteria bacterium RIFOXYC2_FULL_35_25 TaxID=1797582 RepID=A0A1F5EI96_9BACT|nr:MAG: hypothetical protein A2442_01915 [Candidatus Campbellbacteria bacterium RIFOXYC2_FULL_35_25]